MVDVVAGGTVSSPETNPLIVLSVCCGCRLPLKSYETDDSSVGLLEHNDDGGMQTSGGGTASAPITGGGGGSGSGSGCLTVSVRGYYLDDNGQYQKITVSRGFAGFNAFGRWRNWQSEIFGNNLGRNETDKELGKYRLARTTDNDTGWVQVADDNVPEPLKRTVSVSQSCVRWVRFLCGLSSCSTDYNPKWTKAKDVLDWLNKERADDDKYSLWNDACNKVAYDGGLHDVYYVCTDRTNDIRPTLLADLLENAKANPSEYSLQG